MIPMSRWLQVDSRDLLIPGSHRSFAKGQARFWNHDGTPARKVETTIVSWIVNLARCPILLAVAALDGCAVCVEEGRFAPMVGHGSPDPSERGLRVDDENHDIATSSTPHSTATGACWPGPVRRCLYA
jgi:hypothetical protein